MPSLLFINVPYVVMCFVMSDCILICGRILTEHLILIIPTFHICAGTTTIKMKHVPDSWKK